MPAEMSRLIADLSSADVPTKGRAAEALARLGTEARPAAVALVREAGCAEETLREWVVSALENLGPPHEDDLPALAVLIGSDDSEAAYWAITLSGRLEEKAGPAVPALAAALRHSPEPFVRQRAAWALGQIGPAAKDAVPALKEAAQSKDRRLARIAADHAIPRITEAQ